MPPRNLNVILIATIVSAFCYVTYRRARTAMMVGETLEMIDLYYVDEVDNKELLTAAMNGITASLDENSSYIPGDAYDDFQDSINQEFAGIGIFVEQPDEGQPVRVITPLVGSPALRSGILPDDRIISVNDEDVSTMQLQAVSERLKGPIGTSVQVGLRRDDSEELSVTVQRETIELESVVGNYRTTNSRWVYRLRSNPSIAYVRLTSFGEKTVDELRSVLTSLDNEFAGLVIDLRGNSGGLLNAACEISDMFLDSGRIVSTRIRGNVIEEIFNANPGTSVDPSKPVAILIDGGSASASEIVAACLQDNKRATVVGTRSYGKGTVQNVLPLQFGRSALRLTVAKYVRPSSANIHRDKDATDEDVWGVTPNDGFLVKVEEDVLEKLGERMRRASYPILDDSDGSDTENLDDDEGLDYDPQLKRAVEALTQKLNPEASGTSPGKPEDQNSVEKPEQTEEELTPAA